MHKPLRILVTGGSGFVGRLLVEALSANLPYGSQLFTTGTQPVIVHDTSVMNKNTPVEWHSLDIRSASAVNALMDHAKPDVVFHLAALSSTQDSLHEAAEIWDVNVNGSINLAAALQKYAPEATFIFASSSEVYGKAFLSGEALDEKALVSPMNFYARTKLAAEYALMSHISPFGKLVILRLFNHTGSGQDERFVVPSLAMQIARIEAQKSSPVLKTGNLAAFRDFLDVRDVISAYCKLLHWLPQAPAFSLFNIASGYPRSVQSILDQLLSMTQSVISVEQDLARMRASEIASATGNSSAFMKISGWKPQYEWSDTLETIMDSCRQKQY